MRRFLYLDTAALSDYVSGLEGGVRDSVSRRHQEGGTVKGGGDARVASLGGERSHEDEESFVLNETPEARFGRFLRLAPDDDEFGLEEVLDADRHLAEAGIGTLVSVECEIYVPDSVKMLAGGEELGKAIGLVEAFRPLAEMTGQDMGAVPPAEQMEQMREATEGLKGDVVIVGEIDEADTRVAGQLRSQYIRAELDGIVRVVGKVSKRWPAGKWKPLLALPGSSLMPRKKRRELERTQPQPGQEEDYLEGPAVMLDVLALYR